MVILLNRLVTEYLKVNQPEGGSNSAPAIFVVACYQIHLLNCEAIRRSSFWIALCSLHFLPSLLFHHALFLVRFAVVNFFITHLFSLDNKAT